MPSLVSKRTPLWVFVVCLWALACGGAENESPTPWANSTLESSQNLPGSHLAGVARQVHGVLLRSLNPDERQALSNVPLRFPLEGEGSFRGSVTAFYAQSEPPSIVLPLKSLQFLYDLALARSWLLLNGYDISTINNYLLMRKYRRPQDLPGGKYPDPLT